MPEMNTEPKEYLTTAEMAERLKISNSAMYKLMHQKGFPKVKVLSDYRFIESDVKAYLEEKSKAVVND
jgi:excisionase family DNA binding protein